MSLDLQSQSNVFIDAIIKPLFYKKIKWQKEFDLAYWLQQFWNSFHIVSRNNNNLGLSFYNISWETKLLQAVYKVRTLLKAGYFFGY